MQRAALAFAKYRSALPVIPYAYTRTRLIERPHFEVVAMQWAAGSVSPIHDHGASRCWVLMLEGTLEVENFERDLEAAGDVSMRPNGTLSLKADDLDSRNGPHELHRVVNSSAQSAYSLQLYATPITTYNVFDEHTNTSRVVTATCDFVIDLDSLGA
ncbi:MAG TPA: cysteine dioxygenase family protein [Candidatus Acidoferrales bacterium]|jgi:cysteine dioxygenase|nr:cysteine dioxygenase family protein [Candidatus Acidoferrales bacterium]